VPGLGLIINYKTCVIEKPPKNDLPITKSDLIKSLKNKPNGTSLGKILNSSNSSSSSTPQKNLSASASHAPTKNPFKIEVEGRNLSATALLENIDDYTHQLAATVASTNLNQNIEIANTNNNNNNGKLLANKPFFSKLQQIPKSIPNKTASNLAPQIEVKGHNFDAQSNDFDSVFNTNNNNTIQSLSGNNMPPLSLTKRTTLLNDADLFRRKNSDEEIPFKDAFNVSAMLNSKPYQLSRLSTKKSSISGKKK